MERRVEVVEIPLYGVKPNNLVICQGFHGPYHKRIRTPMNLDYAVDLATPVGSVITAARDGVVRTLVMNNKGFSRDMDLSPRMIQRLNWLNTNWILLEHDEDKQTLYAHLKQGSQLVREGQRVFAGQMLAVTDWNGWVGDIQNLHFQMQQFVHPVPEEKGQTETIPFVFRGLEERPMEHAKIFPQAA